MSYDYLFIIIYGEIKLFAFFNYTHYYATQTIGFNIDNFNMINMQHGKGREMTIQRNVISIP